MKYDLVANQDSISITFSGAMTEGVQIALHDVASRLPARAVNVRFDMAGVTSVNSIGIREWLSFIRSLEQRHTFIFAECPAAFMGFALMIPGIVGTGRIESFAAVFRCRTCRTSQEERLTAKIARDRGLGGRVCRDCGNELEAQVSDGPDLQDLLVP